MEETSRKAQSPVEIQLEKSDYFVVPGNSVNIPFWLINHKDHEDYFELSVRGIPLGWVSFSTSVVQVGAGERKEAFLTIQPPVIAVGSAGVYPVVLRVTSQEDEHQNAEADISVKVGAYEFRRPDWPADGYPSV